MRVSTAAKVDGAWHALLPALQVVAFFRATCSWVASFVFLRLTRNIHSPFESEPKYSTRSCASGGQFSGPGHRKVGDQGRTVCLCRDDRHRSVSNAPQPHCNYVTLRITNHLSNADSPGASSDRERANIRTASWRVPQDDHLAASLQTERVGRSAGHQMNLHGLSPKPSRHAADFLGSRKRRDWCWRIRRATYQCH